MDLQLSPLDCIHVGAALEDAVDQLEVLGEIMPGHTEIKHEGNNEVIRLIEHQKQLEAQYEEEMSVSKKKNEKGVAEITRAINANTQAINRSMRRSKHVQDNREKVQQDRLFLVNVLQATLHDIHETRAFTSLVQAVEREKDKKSELQSIVAREEQVRKRVKQLQRAIVENRKEQERELQKRDELIAHLKDQLQETKAKTSMENRYIKKDADVRVSCAQQKCQLTENEVRNKISKINQQLSDEGPCNAEIESYLRSHHAVLEEKVELWMEKYDHDIEAKQAELDNLKSTKAHDLVRLQELTQRYHECSKVVEEDRLEKEKKREEEELERLECEAGVRLQSWWRGVMVRRQLGPYKPKKKGKGKKGGKGGKKGKKK